jgi:hypothetical protein
VSKCVIGCYATGGNGCPAGYACNAQGTAVGACVPLPLDGGLVLSRDGGVGDGRADAAEIVDAAGPADLGPGEAGAPAASAGAVVAGGGCRCDLGTRRAEPRGGLLLLPLAAAALWRRRRGRSP